MSLTSPALFAADPSAVATEWKKPAWLSDLSVGLKECHDDNILMVAEKNATLTGLSPQSSWVTTISPKVGFNFVPLLGSPPPVQTLSFVYAPDFVAYHEAQPESYIAHRLAQVIKGKDDALSFSLDNAFLFNEGDKTAATYALNQTAADGQFDKNRSAYATATSRERKAQIQDRATIILQYDWDDFFIRPTASVLYYNFQTDLHKTVAAPYKGYQNYADRSDANGGADLGFRLTKDFAVTAGYRYGHQYQQAFDPSIDASSVNGRQMQSSANYQRFLLGVEGKPLHWLSGKLVGGPEYRDYNSAAPVDDYHPRNYYGEASVTATINPSQTLALTYKHFQWLSSTGKIPYSDSTYALAYHLSATKELGIDLAAKYLNSDYTCGSTVKTANSSLRNDAMYVYSAGVSYAFNPHCSVSATYTYNAGRNKLKSAGDLIANVPVGYREFDQHLVALSGQYKF